MPVLSKEHRPAVDNPARPITAGTIPTEPPRGTHVALGDYVSDGDGEKA